MLDVVLLEVTAKLEPSLDLLASAHSRQAQVLEASASFPSWLRTYEAGSLAHGTAIYTADADCGMVLDRRSHPQLGPDGGREGPSAILEKVRKHIRDALKPRYPSIGFRITKRAIKVTFNDPLADGSDPTVDLIVGLTKKDEPGLWIPNTEQKRWNPSNPEKHTEMLTDPKDPLRDLRALTTRLAKGENVSRNNPALCSFNIEALALGAIQEESSTGHALAAFFGYAARELDKGPTLDPAGASPAIKLLVDREIAVKRLQRACDIIVPVLDSNNECQIRNELNKLWPDHIDACEPDEGWNKELGKPRPRIDASGLVVSSPIAVRGRQRPVRSYGGTAPSHSPWR